MRDEGKGITLQRAAALVTELIGRSVMGDVEIAAIITSWDSIEVLESPCF
jgi:hypothetical protein